MMNKIHWNRRELLKATGAGMIATAFAHPLAAFASRGKAADGVPPYLAGFEDLYAESPHEAALAWFKAAEFGMFIHYGLYSQLGGEWKGKRILNINDDSKPVAEWAQYHGKIPVDEYAKLKDSFTAEKFDTDFITDLALEADMKFINLTTRHHDSFCLFESAETDFHSMNSPAKRDLVGELAENCQKKGLGLYLYYSHGRDWKHPHAPTREWAVNGRPHYDQPYPGYAENSGTHDIDEYVEFMARQIRELLTNYGPITGIWLDGEGVLKTYGRRTDGLESVIRKMKLKELYAMIREIQPNCLVSYKQGVEGSEDFLTPERTSFGLDKLGKPLEINTTLQAHSWGYNKFTKHRKTADEIMELLDYCQSLPANCCLNTGPMGDGSLVAEEVAVYREVGRRRRLG
jgi:alpha-L-fucosidase